MNSSRISSTLLFSTIFILGACTRLTLPAAPKAPKAPDFRVLTYSSMTGEGSLGVEIEKVFERRCRESAKPLSCNLILIPEEGESSLVSTFIARPAGFDAILGLETLQVAQLKERKEVARSELFSRGPHAFIVDTKVWKDSSKWPHSWKDLAKFPKSVFVQDPRVSSVGIGWLKAIFSQKLISLADAKIITKKVFPSWSLSYAAFQKKGAPLVWSYQSSEAYHRCEEKTDRYRVLPLDEGYPVQEEFVVVPGTTLSEEAKLFMDVVLSDEIQSQIPLKNWMWPASSTTAVPECFTQTTPVKTLGEGDAKQSAAHLREWMDQWSL
ncbi:MAG: thiamine ABC transporter substrate-binding protein [Bdellovibrionota bacterium]